MLNIVKGTEMNWSLFVSMDVFNKTYAKIHWYLLYCCHGRSHYTTNKKIKMDDIVKDTLLGSRKFVTKFLEKEN